MPIGGGPVPLDKPASVAQDPFKSAKWDELAAGRGLSPADAPALTLLVQWYAVVQRCIDDMDAVGEQVAYRNDMGDLRALPQIATMRQASAEIRQLTRQLGLDSPAEGEAHAALKKNRGQTPLCRSAGRPRPIWK